MSLSLKFDIEKFIKLVRARAPLWDTTHNEYSNKTLKQQYWNQVFQGVFPDFNSLPAESRIRTGADLQRRWKSLRNCFSREVAKRKHESDTSTRKRYVYFDALSFLQHSVSENHKSNISSCSQIIPKQEEDEEEEEEEEEEDEEEVEINTPPSQPLQPSSLTMSAETRGFRESNEQPSIYNNRMEDDDRLFLLSLHTHLKSIPNEHKLLAKSEILQVLAKYNGFTSFSHYNNK